MEQAQALGELWRTFRRRFVVLATVSALGTAAAVGYALVKPPVYETSARILVESQQIPTDLARSTVASSAAERLQIIEQRLMARDNLVALIETHGLFADRPELSLTERIAGLRDATEIRSIAVSGQGYGNREISAFTITVRLRDPGQAAAVANEFVTNVLDQNLRARAERARETLAFFETEERRVGDAIVALEGEIAAFKNANEVALPESLEFRRAELARLQESDLEIERRILELEEQRGALETALEGGRPVVAAEPVPRSPEEADLRRLQVELAQKRMIYSPTHPEVQRLENQVAALATLVPAFATDSMTLSTLSGSTEAQRGAIRRQITLLTGQMALLEDQRAVLAGRRAALQASIQETPQVEMALNALGRRHRELQDQYSVITRKRAEAETGEKLEVNQQSERFEVVENALVPEHPVEPNRRKIVALGSGASLGVALALVVLLEMLNPAIRTTAQLERQLGVRPVISIPYVRTTGERRRRRGLWILAALVLGVGIPYGLGVIDAEVMPLGTVWQKILEKTGLADLLALVAARF